MLLAVTAGITPEQVAVVVKAIFSEHPYLPCFLFWDLPDGIEQFYRSVAILAAQPQFLHRWQPILRRIFRDGFGHVVGPVRAAVIIQAVYQRLAKE